MRLLSILMLAPLFACADKGEGSGDGSDTGEADADTDSDTDSDSDSDSDWPELIADADIVITGSDTGMWAGYDVAYAGDVDGDARDDLVIASEGRSRSWLVLAASLEGVATFSLADADVTFKRTSKDLFGESVAPGCDVDGDGAFDLFLRNAWTGSPTDTEVVGALYYASTLLAGGELQLASADATVSAPDDDTASSEPTGYENACADFDGDGQADLVSSVRSVMDSGVSARVAVFSGATVGSSSLLLEDALLVASTTRAADEYVAFKLADAGDVDGDGLGDILVGGIEEAAAGYGVVGLILGASITSGVHDLIEADVIWTGEAAGDSLGHGLAGGGDVDGDGTSDLLIAADDAGGGRGRAYVIFGR